MKKKSGKKNKKRKINDRRDLSLELDERNNTVYKMHRREEKNDSVRMRTDNFIMSTERLADSQTT